MRQAGAAALLVFATMAVWACGSSGSPATNPAAPSPSAIILTIAGQTVLNIGATSQLSARASDGTMVAGATWTSASPAIATVTSDGLVKALAEGATTITATATSVNGRGSVTVIVQQSGSSTVVLTACTNITSPGRYVVDRDMPNTSPCFTIANVAGVQIEGVGHSMRAIVLDHVSHATVTNCVVEANIKMTSSTDVTVSGSTIVGGILWAVQSTNVVFTGNTLRTTTTGLGELILLDSGSNNQVVRNTLSGGYDGGPGNVGTDDGVVVLNESGDVVDDNSISDFYDAGIEGVGALSGTTLSNNTMTNLGVAGVASYWCTAWTNNNVAGNTVSSAPRLVRILYDTGPLCSGPIVPSAFSANQFVGNIFRNQTKGRIASVSIVMPGVVQNNLIQGNDLGTLDGPFLSPLQGFINGGGNLCGPFDSNVSNFMCATTGSLGAIPRLR